MRRVQTRFIVFIFGVSFFSLLVAQGCGQRQSAKKPPQKSPTSTVEDDVAAGDVAAGGVAAGGVAAGDVAAGDVAAGDTSATAASSALTTMFSPHRAPQRKTMGLLQRSFLDLADQGDQELEVAIVVDGTESMAADLAGVRDKIHLMLEDLRRYRSKEVRAAIVVYRDALSPSKEVVIPRTTFTSNPESITKAVEALKPESGMPFFHELPDAGIHAAIEDLDWSDNRQVTKWIFLFGDAPPYPETFSDPENPLAKRRYSTELLISLARKKGISINCVLCTSSEEAYDEALPETQLFMGALSGGTDGVMLDLSDPDIRDTLADAGKQPAVGFTEIEKITEVDLMAVRRRDNVGDENATEVSIAVIPHQPLDQVSFDARDDAVQVSTALSHKLAQLPGVRVASRREIERHLRRNQNDALQGTQAIRGLARRLNVDYVVWGSVDSTSAQVQTAAYRRGDGQTVVQVSLPADRDHGELASVFLAAVGKDDGAQDQVLGQLMKRMQKNALNEVMAQPMAKDRATSRELLAALASLEQALAFEAGSDLSVELLKKAEASSSAAAKAEPNNALAHWLQSNIAYNQAARLYQLGNKEAAEDRMRDMKSYLQLAIKDRRKVESPSLITEIEGDYYLLVKGDVAKAIEKYEAMTAVDQPMQSQLRGHWMLSGIHAGDWGASDKKTIDPLKARRHVVEIMGNWPNSPETLLLKRWLRWDEEAEQTDFNFLPQMNIELSTVSEV